MIKKDKELEEALVVHELLDDYVTATIDYKTSATCNRATYLKQEKHVDDTRYALLSKIYHLISNQK